MLEIDTDHNLAAGRRTGTVTIALGCVLAVHLVIVLLNFTPLMERPSIRQLIGLNSEYSFNSWLSSALLLVTAGAAGLAAHVERSRGAPNRRRRGWIAIGIGFAVLSIDETAAVHEVAGRYADRWFDFSWVPTSNNWVFVVTPVALVFAAWLGFWFVTEFGRKSPVTRLVLAALALWLSVPVWEVFATPLGNPTWQQALEESSEVIGELLLIAAVTSHLKQLAPFVVGPRT